MQTDKLCIIMQVQSLEICHSQAVAPEALKKRQNSYMCNTVNRICLRADRIRVTGGVLGAVPSAAV